MNLSNQNAINLQSRKESNQFAAHMSNTSNIKHEKPVPNETNYDSIIFHEFYKHN